MNAGDGADRYLQVDTYHLHGRDFSLLQDYFLIVDRKNVQLLIAVAEFELMKLSRTANCLASTSPVSLAYEES
jgi:hypothetical protein